MLPLGIRVVAATHIATADVITNITRNSTVAHCGVGLVREITVFVSLMVFFLLSYGAFLNLRPRILIGAVPPGTGAAFTVTVASSNPVDPKLSVTVTRKV